jgi:hypothetical protein
VVHVARDPFAKGSYHRTVVPNSDQCKDCDWCGNKPKTLYIFTWEDDGFFCPPRTLSEKVFCNLDCMRYYWS